MLDSRPREPTGSCDSNRSRCRGGRGQQAQLLSNNAPEPVFSGETSTLHMKSPVSRRRIVQTIGTGSLVALAGCLGSDNGDDEGESGADGSEDEQTGDTEIPAENVVYTFGAEGINVLDLDSEDEFDIADLQGRDWEDIVLTPGQLYAVDSDRNQVHAVETETGTVEDVDVGSDPVHAFDNDGELWVHADGEGTFYIVDTETLDVEETVTVGLEETGHGKIAKASDETAYVTNTNDDGVHVVDLEQRERVETIEFDDDGHTHSNTGTQEVELLDGDGSIEQFHGDETGTHYVEFAEQSGLVFVERLGGGGHNGDDGHTHSLSNSDVDHLHDEDNGHDHGDGETVIVDADDGEITDRLDVGGSLFLSPDEQTLAVIDGDDIHFVDPSDEHGHIQETVTLDGASPDAVRFDGNGYAFSTNPHSGDVSVIDLDGFEELERIDIPGDHLDGIPSSSHSGKLVTISEETLVVIDMDEQTVSQEFEVGEVGAVAYLAENDANEY